MQHGGVLAVGISPDHAAITTAGSQTYTVVASDSEGNPWAPDLGDVTWSHNGSGGFAGATYTPDPADAGSTLYMWASVDGIISNPATLQVRGASGPGLCLAWDIDDQFFYLCANPADPQSAGSDGRIPTANGAYTIGGVSVTVSGAAGNRWVTINNSHHVVNSLQVRWYLRGGAVRCAYEWSTIDDTVRSCAYNPPKTSVDGEYRSGFWSLTHMLDAPDPTSVEYEATQQP